MNFGNFVVDDALSGLTLCQKCGCHSIPYKKSLSYNSMHGFCGTNAYDPVPISGKFLRSLFPYKNFETEEKYIQVWF